MELKSYEERIDPAYTTPVHYWSTYVDMLVGILDWKSKTNFNRFWPALMMNIAVTFLLLWAVGMFSLFNFAGSPLITYSYIGFTYLAMFSLIVRRLHDLGTRRLWALFWFVPLFGSIPVLLHCWEPTKEGARITWS